MNCFKCRIKLKKGKAIKNTVLSSDEGTLKRNGNPIMINVLKCPKCGKSIEI